MCNIFVVGAGGFGISLAMLSHSAGHKVTMWTYSEESAKMLNTQREHKKLLPGVILPPQIDVVSSFEAAKQADLVIIVTPSHAVRDVTKKLAPHLKSDAILCCGSKGLELSTLKMMTDVIEEEVNCQPVVILSGPSHAEEITREVPTAVVAASKTLDAATAVQEMLSTPYFRIYLSEDVTGVELGGALKNIIALAAGIAAGLGLGDNSKAALMTRGIAEIARLGSACGAKSETFGGLSGMGDLIVTCTSLHSRNRRAGVYIGEGLTPAEAIEKVGMTVEGYTSTKAAYLLSQKMNVEMPITTEMYKALYENKNAREALKDLMVRPKKHEFEDLVI